MDDRAPNSSRANNVGAGPGTGDPRPDYPGGSPVDVRDGMLRSHARVEGVGDRAGEPIPGPASNAASRNAIRSTVTPSSTRTGWSAGGMAIPALLVVAVILALMALIL
ncbi:hypothetical protein [Azospirillum sp. sgz302134]